MPSTRVTFHVTPPAPQQRVPWGWFHLQHPDPAVLQIHLMPASDCGQHAFDAACSCGCEEDPKAPGFFTHNAFDKRERYEQGLAKPH